MPSGVEPGIYLKVGGQVGVPPANTKALFVDVDGAVKTLDSTGTKALIGGGGNEWQAARKAALSALFPSLIPTLTFVYVKPTNIQQATSGAAPTINARDSAIIGGAMSPAAAQYLTMTGVIYTDLTTQPHAWVTRARFAPVSANFQSIGPVDTLGTSYVNFCVQTAYDATHLVMEQFKPGPGSTKTITTFVIDGNAHNLGIVFDGTTYYAIVDDAIVGQSSVLTNVTSGNRVFAPFNTTAGDVRIYDLAYGYQLP